MSAKLTTIASAKRHPSHKSVEVLEDALARAKAGEIVEVAVAAVMPDGLPLYYGARDPSSMLLGAINVLNVHACNSIMVTDAPPPAGSEDDKQ